MEEKVKPSGLCTVERGRTGVAMTVKNRPIWEAFSTTLSHGDVQAWVATEGHIWVGGPGAADVCVDVYSSSYRQRPFGCQQYGLPPETMWISEIALALTTHHTQENLPAPYQAAGEWPIFCLDINHSRCSWQGTWSHSLMVPHLSSAAQLALVVWVLKSWWADQLSFHSASDPGLLVGLPQHLRIAIHCIYELLEQVKRLVLQIESCRISMTQGNNRISERSPIEGPRLILYQKLEVNLTNDSWRWTFASKSVWTKGCIVGHTETFKLKFYFLFLWGGRLKDWRADMKGQRDEWNWSAWCRIHKEWIKG
jgi:hypothetical protein